LPANYKVLTPARKTFPRSKRQRVSSDGNHNEPDEVILNYDGDAATYLQSRPDLRVRTPQDFQYMYEQILASDRAAEYQWIDNGTAYKASPQDFQALKEINDQRKENGTADKVVPEDAPQEKIVKHYTQQYFDMEGKHEGQEDRMRIAKILQNFWAGRTDEYPVSESNQESGLTQVKLEPVEEEPALPPRQSLSPAPDLPPGSDPALPPSHIPSAPTAASLTSVSPADNKTDAAYVTMPDTKAASDKSLSILQDMQQRLEMIQHIVDAMSSQHKLTDLRVKTIDTELKEIKQNYKALKMKEE
jgi:hypothetical protein